MIRIFDKKRFYGPSCLPCQCVNGVCNQGLSGNGACTCASGWKGVKCDSPIKPCNYSLPGVVRQVVNTTTSLVTPTATTVLVTGVPTVVNLVASIPLVPQKLDVMLLVDTSATISLSTLLYRFNYFNFSIEVYFKTFDKIKELTRIVGCELRLQCWRTLPQRLFLPLYFQQPHKLLAFTFRQSQALFDWYVIIALSM